jgi:hypothetical protein
MFWNWITRFTKRDHKTVDVKTPEPKLPCPPKTSSPKTLYPKTSKDNWVNRFNQEKQTRGMAPPDSVEYNRNAAAILNHCPDREDTRNKMVSLSKSDDEETRETARKWIRRNDPDPWEDDD